MTQESAKAIKVFVQSIIDIIYTNNIKPNKGWNKQPFTVLNDDIDIVTVDTLNIMQPFRTSKFSIEMFINVNSISNTYSIKFNIYNNKQNLVISLSFNEYKDTFLLTRTLRDMIKGFFKNNSNK